MATETEVLMLRLEANMKKYEAALARAQGQTNKAFGAIEARGRQMEKSLSGLGQGVLSFGASLGVAFGGGALASGFFETALQFERINKAMVVATGSASAARAEMEFIKSTAQRLGLELGSTAQQYAFLAAAARGTSLEGQKIRDIFTGLATASANLGLTVANTEGILRAVQQMISKGTVSAEELRGQMGERLPGAFQAAARAMGMTTQELNKNLELGNILAEDFLPKLAAELQKTAGPNGAQGLQAELNRLSNQWAELQVTFAENGGIAAASTAVQGLTNFMISGRIAIDQLRSSWAKWNNSQTGFVKGTDTIRREMWKRNAMFSPQGRVGAQLGAFVNGIGQDGRDLLTGLAGDVPSLSSGEAPPSVLPPRRNRGGGGGGRRARSGGGRSAIGSLREVEDLAKITLDAIQEVEMRAVALADDSLNDRFRAHLSVNADALESAAQKIAAAYQDMGDVAVDVFDALVEGGGRVEDVMKSIAKQLASEALRGLFGGSGGLGSSIATVFSDIFGRASGGSVNARQPYLVGETGPELFIPRGPGRIAKGGAGGGQTAITIDLRGTTGDKVLDQKLAMAVKTAVAISGHQNKRNFGTLLMDHQMRRA